VTMSGCASAVLVTVLTTHIVSQQGAEMDWPVTGCGFACLSPGDTTLQYLRSPRSTGCLLRGGLTPTATGPPLATGWQTTAFGTHHALVARRHPSSNLLPPNGEILDFRSLTLISSVQLS
jgi:hypothetical protein